MAENRTTYLEAKHKETTSMEKVYWRHLLLRDTNNKDIELFIEQANTYHPTVKFNVGVSQIETTFLDPTVYKGERFEKERILDVCTHFKPTETCQYTHFNSCHPPGVEKRFCQRRSTGFLEQTLQNSHLNLDRTLKISKRALHREATQSNSRRDSLRTIKHEDRKEALKQKTGTHKKLLPFFKQFQPSLPKFEKHTYRQKAFNTKPAITRTFIWVVKISRIPTDRQKNPRSWAQILANPASQRAVKSQIPSRYFAFSRILHRILVKSRMLRIPFQTLWQWT